MLFGHVHCVKAASGLRFAPVIREAITLAIRTLFHAATLSILALSAAQPVTAQGAGPYLAARQASLASDFRAAANYYAQAIVADPQNPVLLENAVMAYISLGQVDRAAAVARRLVQLGVNSQIAHMALLGDGFKRENYKNVREDIDAGMSVGPLVDGLLKAWAQLGEGQMSEALVSFDEVSSTAGIEVFGHYHKALALALVGDYEGAESIFSGEAHGPLQLTRRGLLAYAQVLSQLERNPDAVALIDASFGNDLDPQISQIRADLSSDFDATCCAVFSI